MFYLIGLKVRKNIISFVTNCRYKNYREVFSTRRTEIRRGEGGKHTLIIKSVTEEDIGSVECHARNLYGSVSTRTNLDVNGQ